MNKLFFSIITPVYKNKQFLKECFESVNNQSYNNFEMLVIDNNSDKSESQYLEDLVKSYNKIKLFKQPIKGVSNARNIGLENAQGEFILFLDADDYYQDQDFLQNLHQEIENYLSKNKFVDSIGFLEHLQRFSINETKSGLTKQNLTLLPDTITTGRSRNPNLIKELVHISIPEPALVLPREIIKKARFDVNQQTAEGYSLILAIAEQLENPESIKYNRLFTTGYMYRQSNISTTRQVNWQLIEKEALNRIYTTITDNQRFSILFRHIAFITRLRLNFHPRLGRVLMWYCKLLTNWKF
jgi:glycosyltransferase involved in cell wall biosynthesis